MNLIASTYREGMPFRFRDPPDGATVESRVLRTADGREVRALYWTPSGARPAVAVVAMHPRVDFTHHYAFPALLAGGMGCLGALPRGLGDDTDTIHEDLVLDVAACVSWLKDHRGVRTVVLLGNSGGGSLMALYQAEATRSPDRRAATTPGGRPTILPRIDLVPGDALVLHAAHPGQGRVLLRAIDPSVTDEADPLSVDPALDPYDPRNGFVEPPGESRYPPPFAARFRAAQRARVERIDAVARAALAERRDATDPRTRHLGRVLVVYRTMANLDYLDRSLDPSPRPLGSLLSDRPDLMNYERMGFARVCTPECWLSTWSGLSSRAEIARNLPEVRVPTLIVHADRDRETFPADQAAIDAACRAPDTTIRRFDAPHYFEPSPGQASSPEREALGALLVGWVRERFALGAPSAPARVPGAGDGAGLGNAPGGALHPTARHWRLPPDRPADPRRTNLRSLLARPGRFEHHLLVVGRIGDAQLEAVTASEPLPFAHANVSDEYAVALPTGDPLLASVPMLTLLSDPVTGEDVGRVKHREGDLVLHPYGLLHWPGRLRPPYAPFPFPPGGRRCGVSLVLCATHEIGGGTRPIGVDRDDVKAYAGAVPFGLADLITRPPGPVGEIAGAVWSIVEGRVAPAAGGYLTVLRGGGDLADGDLVRLGPGEVLDVPRGLLLAHPTIPPDPAPPSWSDVPDPPFPPYEEAAPGALPVQVGDLRVEAAGPDTVRVRIGSVASEVPRYWLARFLFRVALHGYRLGAVETYGGFTWDDRNGPRLGLRGAPAVSIDPADVPATIERLYRAVAPDGYVERLA